MRDKWVKYLRGSGVLAEGKVREISYDKSLGDFVFLVQHKNKEFSCWTANSCKEIYCD